jgi:hypothetical protein
MKKESYRDQRISHFRPPTPPTCSDVAAYTVLPGREMNLLHISRRWDTSVSRFRGSAISADRIVSAFVNDSLMERVIAVNLGSKSQ